MTKICSTVFVCSEGGVTQCWYWVYCRLTGASLERDSIRLKEFTKLHTNVVTEISWQKQSGAFKDGCLQ